MTEKDLKNDSLQIFAEAYNTLPVDAKAFKNPIPGVKGLTPKENIKAWVDRKAFIHNLGHASAAYFGYLENPEEKLLWKVLSGKTVYSKTRETMLQAAGIILKKYPQEFTLPELEEHIDNLLNRFQNRALGDTVFRVGCDLHRKLNRDDRLAGAVHLALQEKLPFEKIMEALVTGFYFRGKDENGNLFPADNNFADELERIGFTEIFRRVTGINAIYAIGTAEKIHAGLNLYR